MNTEVTYMAEQVGQEYRGLVIDSKTFKTIFITSHNYPTETIATCAARRAWTDRIPEEIQSFMPSLAMLER
jgi:hypothetical protein